MRKAFIYIILLMSAVSYSQDLQIPDNPFEKFDEETKSRNAFNRERWFYEQRMFPFNTLPRDAYKKATDQRDNMRNTIGFSGNGRSSWNSIGPTSGSLFWFGNISSRISTVEINPADPNILYIGAANGGVWKSTDAGHNWIPKTDFEVSLSSGSIAIDPSNPEIIFYGTGEAHYSRASYYGRGILKSTDGGESWTNYSNGLQELSYTAKLKIRPGHSNELLAAMGINGLYRSTDGGMNWTVLNQGRCDDITFSPTGDTAYAVGSGIGYQMSADGGATFNFISSQFSGTRNQITLCKSSPNVIYVLKYILGGIANIYKSTDAGISFTEVGSSTITNTSQGAYNLYIHVNPSNPDIVYVGFIDIWRSTDGGTGFINLTNGYSGGNVHVDQHNLTFHPTDNEKMYCVNDGGIWYSADAGNSWENLNAGLTLTQFYRMTSDPLNSDHILGGTQDNGTQRTVGTSNWNAAFGGDGGEVCFHDKNNNYILGESQYNGLVRSSDNGGSWVQALNGISGTASWVAPILSHPDSAGIFYTARQQIFKTTDWGEQWFPISNGTSGIIREMAISRSDAKVMYATSENLVYKSTDGGYTYSLKGNGVPVRTITSINIHPDSSDVVLITLSGFGGGQVYITRDGGNVWENISGNLPDSPVNDGMFLYPGKPTGTFIIANDVGVYITNNYGNSWKEAAPGLPNTVAMHLDYNQSANKLRVATHGRGVFEVNLTTVINITNSEVPSDYQLFQNFPNPFNPSTTIRFNIPESDFVTLKIFDQLGREIAELVNEDLNAGSYEFSWNASGLSSGVYFYRLQTKKYNETKKLILSK